MPNQNKLDVGETKTEYFHAHRAHLGNVKSQCYKLLVITFVEGYKKITRIVDEKIVNISSGFMQHELC